MSIRIEKKIVGYEVARDAPELESEQRETAEIIQMHERVKRPERLEGTTYKLKTPVSEHAFYVTINDIILNEGTEHENRRPFEIFVNSKNMDHFQWIVALTRIISAVFRKGGDVAFLVEELKAVFDPNGGYFKKGGTFMPSLVAELGYLLETHLKHIGLMEDDELDEHQRALVEEKRAEYQKAADKRMANREDGRSEFPADARMCGRCHSKAVVNMDNCLTCLNCGDSKCG
ncbi:MAG: NrdJb [Gammaproteobacteria bacterium]|nr:MAG: NrdJb [Gammaproteobacteria bacterium]